MTLQLDEKPWRLPEDFDLPAELASLGCQLRRDANHVARVYPPSGLDDVARRVQASARKQAWNRRRRSALMGTLAAALLLLLAAPLTTQWLLHSPIVARRGDRDLVNSAPLADPRPIDFAAVEVRQPAASARANVAAVDIAAATVSAAAPIRLDVAQAIKVATSRVAANSNRRIISKLGHQRDAELDLLEYSGADPILLAM